MAARGRDTAAPESSGGPRPWPWPGDVLGCLGAMEARLAGSGIEPITDWWWKILRAFYASTARQLVCRVGRRGRKSYTWCLVAVAEILSGRHKIPPGDTGVVAIVSADQTQANDRLSTILTILEKLGVEHKKTTKGIEFPDRPYRVSVLASSISAVSSYTCIMALGDEVTKWKDGDKLVNPAKQVIGSWRATMLTQRNAKMVLLSSPMGFDDAHAQAFARGNNDAQMVAFAETWVANPSVTEADCRVESQAEDDPEIWFLRECAAIPQAGGGYGGVTEGQLDAATARHNGPEPGLIYSVGIYKCPNTGVWAAAAVSLRKCDDGIVKTSMVEATSWSGKSDPRMVVKNAKDLAAKYGQDYAIIPGPEGGHRELRMLAARINFALVAIPVESDMYETIRVRFGASEMEIPPGPHVRADLLGIKAVGVDAGEMRYEASRYAVLIALLASKATHGPEAATAPMTASEELLDQERRMWDKVEQEIAERTEDAW